MPSTSLVRAPSPIEVGWEPFGELLTLISEIIRVAILLICFISLKLGLGSRPSVIRSPHPPRTQARIIINQPSSFECSLEDFSE